VPSTEDSRYNTILVQASLSTCNPEHNGKALSDAEANAKITSRVATPPEDTRYDAIHVQASLLTCSPEHNGKALNDAGANM